MTTTGAGRGQSEQAGLPPSPPRPASLHPASAPLAGPMEDEGWCQGSAQSCCWGSTGQALWGVGTGARAWGACLLSGCDPPGPPPTGGSAGSSAHHTPSLLGHHTPLPLGHHAKSGRRVPTRQALGGIAQPTLLGGLVLLLGTRPHSRLRAPSLWDVQGAADGCFAFTSMILSLPFPSL